jgi:elongation factor Ts
VAADGRRGAVVEVDSETDFVARNEQFQALVCAWSPSSRSTPAAPMAELAARRPRSRQQHRRPKAASRTSAIATIGENMTLRRAAGLSVAEGVVRAHASSVSEGLGKIGVLVALKSTASRTNCRRSAASVAMQYVASNPQAIDRRGSIPPGSRASARSSATRRGRRARRRSNSTRSFNRA